MNVDKEVEILLRRSMDSSASPAVKAAIAALPDTTLADALDPEDQEKLLSLVRSCKGAP
jgi:hypothetical protein